MYNFMCTIYTVPYIIHRLRGSLGYKRDIKLWCIQFCGTLDLGKLTLKLHPLSLSPSSVNYHYDSGQIINKTRLSGARVFSLVKWK